MQDAAWRLLGLRRLGGGLLGLGRGGRLRALLRRRLRFGGRLLGDRLLLRRALRLRGRFLGGALLHLLFLIAVVGLLVLCFALFRLVFSDLTEEDKEKYLPEESRHLLCKPLS